MDSENDPTEAPTDQSRRGFLRGAAIGGAAALAVPVTAPVAPSPGAQAANVYAYLASIQPGPSAARIPLLSE